MHNMEDIVKSTLQTYKYLTDISQVNFSAKTMLAAIMVLPDVGLDVPKMKHDLIKQIAESPSALTHLKEAGSVDRLYASG